MRRNVNSESVSERARRRAEMVVRSGVLLGVDFVPIGRRKSGETADEGAAAPAAESGAEPGAEQRGPLSFEAPARKPGVAVEAKPGAAGEDRLTSELESDATPETVGPVRTADVRADHAGEAGEPGDAGAPNGGAGEADGVVGRIGPEPPPENKRAALDELRARYESDPATAAHLIQGWTNVVFEDGDPEAALMFVGEAPGADEDAQGVPFVGRAGQKLNEMIGAMGLSREAVYIANVLKVRPPGNRTPSINERLADGPYLKEQVRIVRPKVIVTLGKPAANFLLDNDEAMGKLRGRWFEYEGVPLMPTYHPAYLLRSYTMENRKAVWNDLRAALSKLG